MAQWSAARVCEWVMQLDLPPGCADAVREIFADCEVEGDELASVVPKALRRMLAKGGVPDPKIAAEAILKQRDASLSSGCSKKDVDASLECPFCMEPYSEAAPGLRVPRILTACGHSACHGCYAQMLRPITARGHAKPFPCPVCRVETLVRGGQAGSLPKVFSLLR